MALAAELNSHLDAGALAGGLLQSLTAPAQQLNGVSFSLPADQVSQTENPLSGLGSGGIESAVSVALERVTPLLGSLPGADQLLGPLTGAVELAEQFSQGDFLGRLQSLGESLAAELENAGHGSIFSVLVRVMDLLNNGDQARAFRDVLQAAARGLGFNLPTNLPVADILLGAEGAVQVLGGLMSIDTHLTDARQIAERVPELLNISGVRTRIQSLEGLAGSGAAAFLDSVTPDDRAALIAAVRLSLSLAGELETARERVAASFALSEATLVHLDMTQLQSDLGAASAMVRNTSLDPLHRTIASFSGGLGILNSFDPGIAPSRTLDEWLTFVEAKIAEVAVLIRNFDLSQFTEPLGDGIQRVTGVFTTVADLIHSVTVDFRSAMEQVRAAVAAIPIQSIADAVRAFLDPVARAIQAVRDLIAAVEHALSDAADATGAAIGSVDQIVTQFTADINVLFQAAKQAVESVHLEQITSAIQDNVRAFADLLAKAQMKPYFDTASSAIGDAASVIGAVPFSLLPDNMKSDLDEAVRPIKETDANAVKSEIEGILQIEPGKGFALRDDLVAAIADFNTKYHQLLDTIRQHDPRVALAAVDDKLKEIAARIREIEPSVTLQPVQDAVNQAKDFLRNIDLNALLAPVTHAFQQILATIDRYSPAALIEPFEQRLNQVRQQFLTAIGIDGWSAALDDLHAQAVGLLSRIDPAQFEPVLELLFSELRTAIGGLPNASPLRGLGAIIASILESTGLRILPTTFDDVLDWMQGADGSAACTAEAGRIEAALRLALDQAGSLDLTALTAAATANFSVVRASVQNLAQRLAADAPERVQLEAIVPRLDASAAFGPVAANQARFIQLLTQAAGVAGNLRTNGFSEVGLGVRNFLAALDPLDPIFNLLHNLMAGLGFDRTHGLAGALQRLLDTASPQRLSHLPTPLYLALQDRLQALITAILAPIQAGIGEVKRLFNEISLTPLREAMASVVDEVKNQITLLSPDHLLGPVLDSFSQLRNDLLNNDPLQQVLAIIANVKALIAGILEKIKLENILKVPLEIYDYILSELDKVNPNGLIEPILDQLDAIAVQVDEGLTETVAAFQRLQASLPAGAGGASAAVSVGV